ncbi:MAG: cbb3-type cytochrome c oxidase subunit 3 [Gammaproteobacteria bacterium]|nr:cbb3-type cytochrome c oxidase subunit 3 [Gammaproteobacteria bacterium]
MSDYFFTDWGAMTLQDWLGLIVTIVVFLLMIGLYVYVFHPANKEKLEAQRYIPLDEDFTHDDQKDLPIKNGAEVRK